MIFIILWLIFGVLCYLLAEKKGRNKITGFFVGLLFGVFAVVYYLVVGKPKKTCPYCGMKIPREAKVCPYCHKEFDLIKK